MQGHDYLYFFVDKAKRSFYVQNGMVALSVTPVPIQFAPTEWRNMTVENARNSKYFAMDRNFTIPFAAVEDAAMILKDQYFTNGPETIVNLVIMKQKLFFDGVTYGHYYDKFYEGEFDFSTFNHTGTTVTINIMEGGFPKMVKNKENQTFEIDIDTQPNQSVFMDGILLHQSATYIVTNGLGFDTQSKAGTHTVDLRMIGSEGIGSLGAKSQERIKTSNAVKPLWDSQQSFFQNDADTIPMEITYNFSVFLALANGISPVNPTRAVFNIHILTSDSVGTSIPMYQIPVTDPVQLYNHTHTIQGTLNINVPPDARVVMTFNTTSNAAFTFFTYGNEGTVTLEYKYRHRETFIPVITIGQLFREAIKFVTDNSFVPVSNLLNAMDSVKVTSGDAIRNIAGSKIKTSLADVFAFIDSQWDVGMGLINGVVRLEEKGFFIDYANPIQFGSVTNLSVKAGAEYYYSSISVGYADKTYEDVNGKNEFNSKMTFSLPNTRVNKELNKMSPYSADSYGIEYIRINFDGKKTTDATSDNEVFVIKTEQNPSSFPLISAYRLDRSLNATATGVIEPGSTFNYYFSPKRMLERNGRGIHSGMYKQDTQWIKFLTGTKNTDMASGGIVEKGDVLVGNLGKEYYTPNVIAFDSPPPLDLVEYLEASPVRAVQAAYYSGPRVFTFKGLPVRLAINSGSQETQSHTLLSDPDNDLTQLINIFE